MRNVPLKKIVFTSNNYFRVNIVYFINYSVVNINKSDKDQIIIFTIMNLVFKLEKQS
jgi:hypothetical protein